MSKKASSSSSSSAVPVQKIVQSSAYSITSVSSPSPNPPQQPSSVPADDSPVSEPFFKGLGVVYVEVEEDDPASSKCDLCSFARKHPPPADAPSPQLANDRRWGVLHDVINDKTLCVEDEENQHAFHVGCLRAFVLAKKSHFRAVLTPDSKFKGCPVCDSIIIDKSKPGAAEQMKAAAKARAEEKKSRGGDDDDAFDDDEGIEEVGQTGGKARKRDKQMYSVWVHIRQATGLKLVASDKTMNPVAYIQCFGKTVNTVRGDGGKTFNCVWNEAFSFQKKMDEDEFTREVLQVRVEDHSKLWTNTLIGFVKFQLDQVHAQPNHEFYQLSYPIVNMASKSKKVIGQNITMQGQLEISVCVISEEDVKDDPKLPIHIYDAEVEMWAELQQKQEVVDFDLNKNYLQNNLDLKKEQDLAKTHTLFDILHIKIYKAEDLPRLDKMSSSGWCDAFIELEYKGLMSTGSKLKSKPVMKTANPIWNQEFTLPIISGAPLVYNSFDLVVKDHNTFGANEYIGKCGINISDIISMYANGLGKDGSPGLKRDSKGKIIQPPTQPPMWKSLYQDIDGKAPTYRGRILVEFSIEYESKDAKLLSQVCSQLRESELPMTGSYRLDFELLEGIHLLENYSDYQVDITLGHTLTVGNKNEADRVKGGKCWMTIESDMKNQKGSNKTIVPFLTKKSMMLHNMPYPRKVDQELAEREKLKASTKLVTTPEGGADASATPTGPTQHLDENGAPIGWTGDATQLGFNSISKNFTNNTCQLDYKSAMPDLIVYVSKKGDRKDACVGYLRIPLNSLKRPTENWEHGEDMTIFPHLWDAQNASARCLPLKPLVELYQLTSGFLLFKATLTPVSGPGIGTVSNQCVTTKLEAIPRQRYKFIASIYQAKDMASVDPSGLSSPFATVQIGDQVVKSKHKVQTCFPLWFETVTASVELPVNLLYAPDFSVTCYHHKSSLFKFNDPSIFMGRADIPAYIAQTTVAAQSVPAWYPLQFEEHQYGNILLSFRLLPESSLIGVNDSHLLHSGVDKLVSGWENYAVEVSALDIRGKMAVRQKMKKVDPVYQIECWEDIQNYKQSAISKEKFTCYIRKPSNPVYYSSINFRIYEGKELTGVTSLPVHKILRSGASWYKLMELILREESMTAKRVIRKWRSFIQKKHFVDPRTIRKEKKQLAPVGGVAVMPNMNASMTEQDGVGTPSGTQDNSSNGYHSDPDDSLPAQTGGGRFAYLQQKDGASDSPHSRSNSTSKKMMATPKMPRSANKTKPADSNKKITEKTKLTSDVGSGLNINGSNGNSNKYGLSDDVSIDVNDSEEEKKDSTTDGKSPTSSSSVDDSVLDAASKPRNVDAEGNEIIEEKDLRYLQCEQLPNKDPGNPFETHWRVECEYEMLPLVNDPFIENELFVGKDEIHSTFLEKLFARSKHSVGKLRAHFYGYRIGKLPEPNHAKSSSSSSSSSSSEIEPSLKTHVNPLFDEKIYFNPIEYCIRVYLLRGLQLTTSKGKSSGCDPFVSLTMSGSGEQFKSEIKEGTLNPQFYQVFEFSRMMLPSADSTLSISVMNDNTILTPDLIGTTEISLENRLCSKPWQQGQKPIERRALKKSKTGRLPQGFIEVCVQILPQYEAGNRSLDYLLSPPRRLPWELRVTLLNCKKVTMKKIYKKDDDCCCYDLCAPPNQSDIKLVACMSGSKQKPQSTDTHPRSIDGDGMFNWRTIFDVDLPSPQMLCNLKVQIWNINWNPDDCIAEAIIPLWGFFELARRELQKSPDNPDKLVRHIPRQWVHLTHPQNTDVGDVEIEIELLPKEMADRKSYIAAKGEDGFDAEKNAPNYVLEPPNRPDDSFPWYRLDKQILWRCKYFWKKAKWWLFLCLCIFIGLIAGVLTLHKEGYL